MTLIENDEHWRQLANPGHVHTRDAIVPLLERGPVPPVLNCAATLGPAKNLTDFSLPAGLSVADCLQAAASGIIPDSLHRWKYSPRIRAVKQLPFLRSLPEQFKSLRHLPWFENQSPVRGLGINARHLRYHHDLWQQLRPKTLRGVHTTLVLAMPQIGYALTPHIQLEKSFLSLGSLARGLCATQLFPAKYLFPDADLGALADVPAPIFADLLPATCGYAWPCVDLEPDPWRVLTRYERSDRYYGYPFSRTTGLEDAQLKNVEAGTMLLPNGTKVCARASESFAYATQNPGLHRLLKLDANGFERETGLLRGTVTHDGLPFLLPTPMQSMVYAVIVGTWEMELDRPGNLTGYTLRTRHAAIRGHQFYQRMEPYYSQFMRLVTEVANHPDFCTYPLSSHLTDSWLGGNLCLSNQLSPSEEELRPEFMRQLYHQQLDWQVGVTNLMNHPTFRTKRTGGKLLPLSGEEIERQLNIEGLVFHQLQSQLRFDSHLFPRPVRSSSFWPGHHPGWSELDAHQGGMALPKL